MVERGITAPGAAALPRFTLPDAPISHPFWEVASIVLLCPILLSVAAWNGFPIIFYDTGAYMLQGLGLVFVAERSPVYSLFLREMGGATSLWLVAIAQCAIVGFVMTEFARAVRPMLSLWTLLAIAAILCLATGLPWYAAQIEPDCFVGLVPIVAYLFAFHDEALGPLRKTLLAVAAVIAIAAHPSHVALAALLLLLLAAMRLAPERWIEANGLPRPRILIFSAGLIAAIAVVLLANYGFTKEIFFSRSGAIFLEARIMEDGLIAPVLDSDCPKANYAVCPYRDRLPSRADSWLWTERLSPFHKLGGFRTMEKESARLIAASVVRYPLENAIVAMQDAVLQFFWFQTGDGIVPQEWVLNREFGIAIPQQVSAYDRAYQQEGEISFVPINLVHVPVAFLSLAGLYLILRQTWLRRDWRSAVLPAFILAALIGNAFVCGVFSGAHGRYQSRIMWLPVFAVALIAAPRIESAMRRNPELNPATG
jgi:hypothetical protein